jgi:hypothetical protein
MMKQILVLLLMLLIIGSSRLVQAQQPKNLPWIVLTRPERSGDTASLANIEALRQGLRDRGYVEGQNITLEILWLAGEPGGIAKRLTDSTRH